MRHPSIRIVTSATSHRYIEEGADASPSEALRSRRARGRRGGAIARVAAKRWVRAAAFLVALAALLAFSFLWVWNVGHRGLFMLDQSIVFDGAWRMLQGQVPYRDFVMPFGPVTFALCALMFRLAGVDFSSLVLTAAAISLVVTAVAVRLSWLLTGRSGWLALLAGAMTAVWFQAPFGTPWMEQTAFLMNLLALWGIVEGRLRVPRHGVDPARGSRPVLPSGWSSYGLAGVATVTAVLSKQNAGGLFACVCLGALWVPGHDRPRAGLRATFCYAAGVALAGAAFLAWLLARSDARAFVHYWIDVSAEIGASRVVYWKVLGALVFQPLLSSSIPLFLVSSLAGVATLALSIAGRSIAGRSRAGVGTRWALAAWLCVALPQFHGAFQLTTNNDASNNNAYVGLAVVCLAALIEYGLQSAPCISWNEGSERVRAPLFGSLFVKAGSLLVGALVLYSLAEGLMVAHGRFVQEFTPGVSFTQRLGVPGASRVLWGEPTRITPQFCSSLGDMCKISSASTALDHSYDVLQREDFEGVAGLLRQRSGNFFVFPDTTMLYGLTGRPSPQPLLYFHPGQSYSLGDQAELDRAIVDSLERHRVSTVVLERASFMGTHKLLAEFPRLDTWIAQNFELSRELGNYLVFDARIPAPSAAR